MPRCGWWGTCSGRTLVHTQTHPSVWIYPGTYASMRVSLRASGHLLEYPGTYPNMFQTTMSGTWASPRIHSGVPGYITEYDPNEQVWYPGIEVCILWGYPDTSPSMNQKYTLGTRLSPRIYSGVPGHKTEYDQTNRFGTRVPQRIQSGGTRVPT